MFKSLDMGTEVKRDIAESRRLMTYFNSRVIILILPLVRVTEKALA